MRFSAALLFHLLAVFGCNAPGGEGAAPTTRAEGSSQSPAPQPPTAASTSAQVEASAADSGPGEWTAGIVDIEKSPSGVVTLVSSRTATHESFDRFVLEFDGDELPDYHLEYIDRPVRQCGSGNTVELAGDGWLEVRLEPARAHDDRGRATVEQRESSLGLPVIVETELTCDFEAVVVWVLGVASPNAYRVTELASPARLVVDLRK